MKIKLAILEHDTSYLNRIVSVFSTKYSDNFELYSFTDQNVATSTLNDAKIDVLLADDGFEIDPEALPRRCALAYMVESADIDTVRDQIAIFKYQKVELIYKQILGLYAEKAGSISGLRMADDSCGVVVFLSPAGGVGSSSLAAACAMNYAAKGKRCLYLNVEKFGESSSFFSGEGQFDMSDVAFSLKSRKANLALKLESYVRKSAEGVFFFAPAKIALDMMELGAGDITQLISELQLTGSYDSIVLDADFSLDQAALEVYRTANTVVIVSDGSEIANTKTMRAYEALSTVEQNADSPLMSRIKLVYNKFSNKTSRALEGVEIKNIGGAPRFEHATAKTVVKQLAGMSFFDGL